LSRGARRAAALLEGRDPCSTSLGHLRVERHLQQLPDGADFDHQGIELGQPLPREPAPALGRRTARNVIEKPLDFAQSQPDELGKPHDR